MVFPGCAKTLDMPFQDILVGDLLGAIDEHDIEALMHSPAGQSIAYFNEVKTVAEIFADLADQVHRSLKAIQPLHAREIP